MSPETRTLQRLAVATEARARSLEVQWPHQHVVRWCAGAQVRRCAGALLAAPSCTKYKITAVYTDRTGYSSVYSDLSTDRGPPGFVRCIRMDHASCINGEACGPCSASSESRVLVSYFHGLRRESVTDCEPFVVVI
jgi:hypothetical protein